MPMPRVWGTAVVRVRPIVYACNQWEGGRQCWRTAAACSMDARRSSVSPPPPTRTHLGSQRDRPKREAQAGGDGQGGDEAKQDAQLVPPRLFYVVRLEHETGDEEDDLRWTGGERERRQAISAIRPGAAPGARAAHAGCSRHPSELASQEAHCDRRTMMLMVLTIWYVRPAIVTSRPTTHSPGVGHVRAISVAMK